MLKRFHIFLPLILCLAGCKAVSEPVDMVNPYIGNISHLLVPTYPTVHRPNGMLRLYPAREDYTSDTMDGLPLAVTSHRGKSAFSIYPHSEGLCPETLRKYAYGAEKITPYSWEVDLEDASCRVKYSPSERAGLYEVEFSPESEGNSLVFSVKDGSLRKEGNCVEGFQRLQNDTRIFIHAEFSPSPLQFDFLEEGDIRVGFGLSENVTVKYGISFIDESQARENMEKEVSGKTYRELCREGRREWNRALSKIEVEGGSDEEKTVFYTALYRTYERMININEAGRYWSPYDRRVHSSVRPFYTDDWIWDSYRAAHPLRVLLERGKEADMLSSLVEMASQSGDGWMPTFPEIDGDSHRMNGNHAVAAFLDALRKGVEGFDADSAYVFCRNALLSKSLLPWTKTAPTELDEFYFRNGYFPALREGEAETCAAVNPSERRQAVAVTLAHAYDCWCAGQLALETGHGSDAELFEKYSLNYRNLFNPRTRFFHPKASDGEFITPFDYRFSGGQGARDYYDENNAWTYRWDLQHNIPDLISLMGGEDAFAEALDSTFREPLGMPKFEFYSCLPDQTGNVGQFTMANEPSLHIPYLYDCCSRAWMTQKRVRTLLREWFRDDLMGVPGDEDGGGMSAFVVFSMMGFYPLTPGVPEYALGSPVFSEIRVHLENGRTFTVKAPGNSQENIYIQSASLDGKSLRRPFISHSDILGGGELLLRMGPHPCRECFPATEQTLTVQTPYDQTSSNQE